MKLVMDTNVLISGLFFSGPSYSILDAWRRGAVQLVVSPAILVEYLEVSERLAGQFPEVDPRPLMDLLMARSTVVDASELPCQICTGPDEDNFRSNRLREPEFEEWERTEGGQDWTGKTQIKTQKV